MLETTRRVVNGDGMTLNMTAEPESKPAERQRPRKKLSFRDPEIVGRDKYRQVAGDRSIIKGGRQEADARREAADGGRAESTPERRPESTPERRASPPERRASPPERRSPPVRVTALVLSAEERFLDVIANDAVVGVGSLEDVNLESQALEVVRTVGQAFEVCHSVEPSLSDQPAPPTSPAPAPGAAPAAAAAPPSPAPAPLNHPSDSDSEPSSADAAKKPPAPTDTSSEQPSVETPPSPPAGPAAATEPEPAEARKPPKSPGERPRPSAAEQPRSPRRDRLSCSPADRRLRPEPPLPPLAQLQQLQQVQLPQLVADRRQMVLEALSVPTSPLDSRRAATLSPDALSVGPDLGHDTLRGGGEHRGGGSSSLYHQLQLMRERLVQQQQQTQATLAQVHLVRDQLQAETAARLEAQSRTHQLLLHNKELLDHVQVLVAELQAMEERDAAREKAAGDEVVSPVASSTSLSSEEAKRPAGDASERLLRDLERLNSAPAGTLSRGGRAGSERASSVTRPPVNRHVSK